MEEQMLPKTASDWFPISEQGGKEEHSWYWIGRGQDLQQTGRKQSNYNVKLAKV